MHNKTMWKLFCFAFSLAFVLVGWHITSLLLATPALPTPLDALTVCARYTGELLPDLGISAYRMSASLVLGCMFGVPVGIALGRCATFDELFAPALYLLYPIPKIVLLPILLVLLGFGNELKIALITLTVFFQVVVVMRDAAKTVPNDLIASARMLGIGNIRCFVHVIIPSTLPQLFTTLRVSSAVAIAVLFFAEAIAGSTGLGYFIMNSWGMVNYPRMFAGIVALALLGVVFYVLFDVLERRLSHQT